MILIAHIVIALASIVFASFLLLQPSRSKIVMNYTLIASTIASGTYLIITTHENMLGACLSGLAYLAVVITLTAVAHRKLAHQTIGN